MRNRVHCGRQPTDADRRHCPVGLRRATSPVMTVWLELAIVVGLVLLNGFFAMAEMAVVSSRRIRLQQMAEDGNRGAARALALAENPGRFLSGVQVGITLIGIMSGAFGGATLGARLGHVLDEYPVIAPHGEEIAFIARGDRDHGPVGHHRRTGAEAHRAAASRADRGHGRAAAADRRHDRAAAGLVFRNTRPRSCSSCCACPKSEADNVTEEEVKIAIAEGTEAGVIDEVEEEMIHGVLALADSSVASIMMPRPDVYWIDLEDDAEGRSRATSPNVPIRASWWRATAISAVRSASCRRRIWCGDLIAGRGIRIEEQLLEPALRAGNHAGAAAAGDLPHGAGAHRFRGRRIRRLSRPRDTDRRAGGDCRRTAARSTISRPRISCGGPTAPGWSTAARRIRSRRKAEAAQDIERRLSHRRGLGARAAGAHPGRGRDVRNSTAGASRCSTWTASGSTSCCSPPAPETDGRLTTH